MHKTPFYSPSAFKNAWKYLNLEDASLKHLFILIISILIGLFECLIFQKKKSRGKRFNIFRSTRTNKRVKCVKNCCSETNVGEENRKRKKYLLMWRWRWCRYLRLHSASYGFIYRSYKRKHFIKLCAMFINDSEIFSLIFNMRQQCCLYKQRLLECEVTKFASNNLKSLSVWLSMILIFMTFLPFVAISSSLHHPTSS